MKAVVDQVACIGCALCVEICPEIFKMEGEKATAYEGPCPSNREKACREAADQCPVNAINIEP
jgi:ferredoxin